jgi:hypothetical protein
MSSDGFSALAVDNLGRSLMGWQLAGWQFQIPHAPLTVKFLEPGAAYAAPPEFLPIPSRTPDTETETPQGDPSPAAPLASTPVALQAYEPPSMSDAGDAHGEQVFDSGGSATTAYPQHGGASAFPADAGVGAAPAGGGMSFSGALEVLGQVVEDVADIFEFNVIFQLNVLLDSDFVVQEIVGASDASLLGLGFGQSAFTGGNTQTNSATIMDAGDHGDFSWLGGRYYETNAIYSLNALDDGDIAFNLISGSGLNSAQSITTGGNTQINEATIHSLTGGAGAVPEGVQIGANDTVEYNITTQVNFMNDGDVVGQQIFGGGSGTQTANTGGNSQSNTALLIDDNAAPGHEVPGNYYEYNLIYQTNVMEDGDQIAQLFSADPSAPDTPDSGFAADDDALPHGLYGDALA